MIQQIKDKRRKRAARKQLLEGMPTPKPEWVEAFLILLLHKTGGTLTVSVADLERFERLKTNNKTIMTYDNDSQTITLVAPEMTMPEIVTPSKKIITET
jgi:hypothetical protein